MLTALLIFVVIVNMIILNTVLRLYNNKYIEDKDDRFMIIFVSLIVHLVFVGLFIAINHDRGLLEIDPLNYFIDLTICSFLFGMFIPILRLIFNVIFAVIKFILVDIPIALTNFIETKPKR